MAIRERHRDDEQRDAPTRPVTVAWRERENQSSGSTTPDMGGLVADPMECGPADPTSPHDMPWAGTVDQCLDLLRSDVAADRIRGRTRLASIFERRGLLNEAA